MYCPNCASQIHNDVKFCVRCGLNLTMVSDLVDGSIIQTPQSEELIKLLGKIHNGYLSTVIGFSLVVASLLIVIAAMAFGVMAAALSGLIFLGWGIPAMAQGVGKWLSAKNEMAAILEGKSRETGGGQPQNSLTSMGMSNSAGFAGSVTEGTTANLDRHASEFIGPATG